MSFTKRTESPTQLAEGELTKAELEFLLALISNADIRIRGNQTQMLYTLLLKLQQQHANR